MIINISFNPFIPQPADNLSQSQGQILTNFTTSNNIFGMDHLPFNNGSLQAGYHTIIHQNNPSINTRLRSGSGATTANFPTAISGVNQVFQANWAPQYFAGPATTDTQLFALTGNNILAQLTGYSGGARGYAWVGGILIQWGQVGSAIQNIVTQVGFLTNVAPIFPNNCWTIFASPQISTGTNPIVIVSAVSNQKFQYFCNSITQFAWFAIGN